MNENLYKWAREVYTKQCEKCQEPRSGRNACSLFKAVLLPLFTTEKGRESVTTFTEDVITKAFTKGKCKGFK